MAKGTRRIITNPGVATPGGPSSHAVRVGNLIFTALTTPRRPDGSIPVGDFKAQMVQCMENLKAILEGAGSSLDRVVKTTVVLPRITDVAEMNRIYMEYFQSGNYPARATIEARMGNPDYLVEIECVAEADPE